MLAKEFQELEEDKGIANEQEEELAPDYSKEGNPFRDIEIEIPRKDERLRAQRREKMGHGVARWI